MAKELKETVLQAADTFSKEYVQDLRNENASWRMKYRELEAQSAVGAELTRRGVQADPSWVKVKDGQSVAEAVEQLAVQFPHLVKQVEQGEEGSEIDLKTTVSPLAKTNPNTNTPTQSTAKILKERNLAEIKKDPVARKALRANYRQLLMAGSNQKDALDY